MALTTFLSEKDCLFIRWSSSEVTEDYEISWTLSVKIFWANLILTLKVAEFRRFSLFLASSNSAWWQPAGAGEGGWLQLDPGHTGDGSGAVPPAHASAELLAIVGNFIWNIKIHWEATLALHFKLNSRSTQLGATDAGPREHFHRKSRPVFSNSFQTFSSLCPDSSEAHPASLH